MPHLRWGCSSQRLPDLPGPLHYVLAPLNSAAGKRADPPWINLGSASAPEGNRWAVHARCQIADHCCSKFASPIWDATP